MKKNELMDLLKKLDIPCNEGITPIEKAKEFPRIDLWCIAWEYRSASGISYDDVHTYQISFYSKIPNDQKLRDMRDILSENDMLPLIQHEFVDKQRVWHSYFAVEVIEG